MADSVDLEARVMMVRPRLFILFFFFTIHTSASAGSSSSSSIRRRPCDSYHQCRFLDSGIPRIGYGEFLNSSGGSFTLGFFVSGNNNNVFLGTWYGASPIPLVIVWVANRNKPIPYRSRHNCSLIGVKGDAVLLDSNTNRSYWSTTVNPATQTYLQISDKGNLELLDGADGQRVLWQSFDHPTDTFLPGMDFTQGLSSWNTPQDPATGSYLLTYVEGELLMMNLSSSTYMLSPYWSSHYSSLHPDLLPLLQNRHTTSTANLRVVMNATGRLQLWENGSVLWEAPTDQCDSYDPPCHMYGVCDPNNAFKCRCLPGYVPSDPPRWESGDFTGGCSKKTTDACGQIFFPLPMAKLPNIMYDTNVKIYSTITSEAGCRNHSLTDCANQAFTFDAKNSICLIWRDEIYRIQQDDYGGDGHIIYIRVNASEIESGSRACEMCGTNVVPYPLSTNGSCGDPYYFSFTCNDTNGHLYFNPPSGRAYIVSHINPPKRMFTVQLVAPTNNLSTDYKCNSTTYSYMAPNEFRLHSTSLFSVTTNCSIATVMNRKVVEVGLSWKPPLPPICSTTADCQDWPGSTCNGVQCACTNKGFEWDSQDVSCIKSKGGIYM